MRSASSGCCCRLPLLSLSCEPTTGGRAHLPPDRHAASLVLPAHDLLRSVCVCVCECVCEGVGRVIDCLTCPDRFRSTQYLLVKAISGACIQLDDRVLWVPVRVHRFGMSIPYAQDIIRAEVVHTSYQRHARQTIFGDLYPAYYTTQQAHLLFIIIGIKQGGRLDVTLETAR